MDSSYWNFNVGSVDMFSENLKVNMDDTVVVVINPCFEDYSLIQWLINGYTEMKDINRIISHEFASCELENNAKY